MDEVPINIIIFFPTIFLALSYSYFISSKLPKGIYKLISLLPIFYTFTILPLLIPSAFASAITAFFFTWLANFKLILFAFDQGPLYHTNSLIQFITIASLPVKLKANHPSKQSKKPSLNLWIELFISPLLINFVYDHKQSLHPHVLLAIYCCLVFLLVDNLVFISNILIKTLIGVELEPPSDKPYLATSLQDFWGRRWNLIVTNILRQTIYKPVKSMFPNKHWAWLPAIVATFIVSGLMHELLFFYVAYVTPTMEITYFFVLHGICVVTELIIKRVLAGRFELPVVVARLFTVGFVVVTSFWLFFPPLIKSGADVKVLDEFRLFVSYFKTMVASTVV